MTPTAAAQFIRTPLPRLLYFRYLLRISIKMYDDPPPPRFLLGPPDWDLGDPLPL